MSVNVNFNKWVVVKFLVIVFWGSGVIIPQQAPDSTGRYCIVIHGGAGYMDNNMPDSLKEIYNSALDSALKIGRGILADGGSSLDAVERTVRYLEDNPYFNAGKGAVLNADGHVEMDASIMDGKDLRCGAVAGLSSVKNPISLARMVMEKTSHILLAGKGAETFADSMHVEREDSAYFTVPERLRSWKKFKSKMGTVGAVALDKFGNLAAATSTGGMTGKMPGRIGDSPLINAGTYASNKTCAVSCTGVGEEFIRHTVAYKVAALMEFKLFKLSEAAYELIYHELKPNDGGLIAVDREGNYTMEFNTPGMFRGVANSDGEFKTALGK